VSEERAFETNLQAVFEPSDYLRFYGDGLSGEQTTKEVSFVVRELGLTRPMTLLDLACGYGRHANRLSALGHDVTGIDITQGFIEMAREDAKTMHVEVKYVVGDMRDIDFSRAFDRVICMSGSLGYFSDGENFRVLENVSRALKNGGLFLLDLPNRDFFIKNFLPYVVEEKGNDLMIDLNRLNIVEGRLYDRRIMFRDGIMKEKPFFTRLYAPTEIRDLLERVDLKVLRFFGNYDSSPLQVNSRRMLVLAEKGHQ
jgi:SAM-dependent methyltransferase